MIEIHFKIEHFKHSQKALFLIGFTSDLQGLVCKVLCHDAFESCEITKSKNKLGFTCVWHAPAVQKPVLGFGLHPFERFAMKSLLIHMGSIYGMHESWGPIGRRAHDDDDLIR